MVHALAQAHRVLTPHGTLVDLHPDRGPLVGRRRLPIVVRGRRAVRAGHLQGRPGGYGDYLAADRAIERVVRRGLFTPVSSEVFPFKDHLRSLPSLDRLLDSEWTETRLGSATRRRLVALLRADPGATIVVVESVRLNILRKA